MAPGTGFRLHPYRTRRRQGEDLHNGYATHQNAASARGGASDTPAGGEFPTVVARIWYHGVTRAQNTYTYNILDVLVDRE